MKQTQSDIDAAMAEFLAKSAPTTCPPVLSAKQSQELAKQARQAAQERERRQDEAERAERNAENQRYDSEGVWYVGGKL